MWEQVKRAIVESAREVCGSVRVGERNQNVCCGTMRKKLQFGERGCLEGRVAASDEEAKERCMEGYREEKRKVKRCIY